MLPPLRGVQGEDWADRCVGDRDHVGTHGSSPVLAMTAASPAASFHRLRMRLSRLTHSARASSNRRYGRGLPALDRPGPSHRAGKGRGPGRRSAAKGHPPETHHHSPGSHRGYFPERHDLYLMTPGHLPRRCGQVQEARSRAENPMTTAEQAYAVNRSGPPKSAAAIMCSPETEQYRRGEPASRDPLAPGANRFSIGLWSLTWWLAPGKATCRPGTHSSGGTTRCSGRSAAGTGWPTPTPTPTTSSRASG